MGQKRASKPGVALVHEWIVDLGGAEKVLKALKEIFPEAPVFVMFHRKKSVMDLGLDPGEIKTSFLQHVPGITTHYRKLLPLYPAAVESLDVSGYDLIISSTHVAAKGILPGPFQKHISYCHTPPRYLWDLSAQYLELSGLGSGIFKVPAHVLLNYMRVWDVAAAARVDAFIANSTFTAKRIERYYGVDSTVIHPPVETDRFRPSEKGNYFVFVSRLVQYKRADLAVQTFNRLGDRLIVVGDGPELKKLKKAAGPNIEFTGRLHGKKFEKVLAGARALIYPAMEDFGIVMAEAMAAGTPVIALACGGALDIVTDPADAWRSEATGVLFPEQTAESLGKAVTRFKEHEPEFRPEFLAGKAGEFSEASFKKRILGFVESFMGAVGG